MVRIFNKIYWDGPYFLMGGFTPLLYFLGALGFSMLGGSLLGSSKGIQSYNI